MNKELIISRNYRGGGRFVSLGRPAQGGGRCGHSKREDPGRRQVQAAEIPWHGKGNLQHVYGNRRFSSRKCGGHRAGFGGFDPGLLWRRNERGISRQVEPKAMVRISAIEGRRLICLPGSDRTVEYGCNNRCVLCEADRRGLTPQRGWAHG